MYIFCVDHDHKTNKIRGLLCNSCNRGLGYFRDDIRMVRKAAKYLERRGYNVSQPGTR